MLLHEVNIKCILKRVSNRFALNKLPYIRRGKQYAKNQHDIMNGSFSGTGIATVMFETFEILQYAFATDHALVRP